MKINYKSDFSLMLKLRAATGEQIDFPENADWTLTLRTSGAQRYAVSHTAAGNVYSPGLYLEDRGAVSVYADGHGLAPGRLKVDFECRWPDPLFPDGDRLDVMPMCTDVELVTGPSDTDADLMETCVTIPAVVSPSQLQGLAGEAARLIELPYADDSEIASMIDNTFNTDPQK